MDWKRKIVFNWVVLGVGICVLLLIILVILPRNFFEYSWKTLVEYDAILARAEAGDAEAMLEMYDMHAHSRMWLYDPEQARFWLKAVLLEDDFALFSIYDEEVGLTDEEIEQYVDKIHVRYKDDYTFLLTPPTMVILTLCREQPVYAQYNYWLGELLNNYHEIDLGLKYVFEPMGGIYNYPPEFYQSLRMLDHPLKLKRMRKICEE